MTPVELGKGRRGEGKKETKRHGEKRKEKGRKKERKKERKTREEKRRRKRRKEERKEKREKRKGDGTHMSRVYEQTHSYVLRTQLAYVLHTFAF